MSIYLPIVSTKWPLIKCVFRSIITSYINMYLYIFKRLSSCTISNESKLPSETTTAESAVSSSFSSSSSYLSAMTSSVAQTSKAPVPAPPVERPRVLPIECPIFVDVSHSVPVFSRLGFLIFSAHCFSSMFRHCFIFSLSFFLLCVNIVFSFLSSLYPSFTNSV